MIVSRGLIVACGEDAVRDGLDELERQNFPDGRPERLFLPGGCWWLAQASEASSGRLKRIAMNRSGVVEAVRDLLAAKASRIVLTGHQDCAWYRRRYPAASPGDLVKRIGADIYAARDEAVRLAGHSLKVQGTVLVRVGDSWEPRVLF